MLEDTSTAVAFYAAANAAALLAEEQNLDWITLGAAPVPDLNRDVQAQCLANFVRASPGAPPEALYRAARGLGFHTAPPDGWVQQPYAWRAAYATFLAVLPVFDKLSADLKAEERAAAGAYSGPVLAAALIDTDIRDTVLRTAADDPVTNPHMAVVLIDNVGSNDANLAEPGEPLSGVDTGGAGDPEPAQGLSPIPEAGNPVPDTGLEPVGPDLGDVAEHGAEPVEVVPAPEETPPAEAAAAADPVEETAADAPVSTRRKRSS